MDYTEEQITKVKDLAKLFVPITDIATVLEVPAHELRRDIADTSSAVSVAYRTSKVAAKLIIRDLEMKQAKLGSPTALENADKYLMDMEDDE